MESVLKQVVLNLNFFKINGIDTSPISLLFYVKRDIFFCLFTETFSGFEALTRHTGRFKICLGKYRQHP